MMNFLNTILDLKGGIVYNPNPDFFQFDFKIMNCHELFEHFYLIFITIQYDRFSLEQEYGEFSLKQIEDQDKHQLN